MSEHVASISPNGKDDHKVVFKNLLAGGIAGAISRTVVSPLERLKILFQIQNGSGRNEERRRISMTAVTGDNNFNSRNLNSNPKGIFSPSSTSFPSTTTTSSSLNLKEKKGMKRKSIQETLSTIKRNEGWRGFFKGNGTNVIRIIPYSAVQFASFEFFKRILLRNRGLDLKEGGQLTMEERFLAGAAAGICSVTCTYPLDLIRTRLSLGSEYSKEKTIFGSLKRIYGYEGGIIALYKGIVPTLMV